MIIFTNSMAGRIMVTILKDGGGYYTFMENIIIIVMTVMIVYKYLYLYVFI